MGQAGDKRRNKEVAAVYHFSIFTTLLKKQVLYSLSNPNPGTHNIAHGSQQCVRNLRICFFSFRKLALELKEESFRQISRSPSDGSGHCEDPGGFHRIN